MTSINFYHLTRSTIKETLPKLLSKIIDSDKRVLLVAANENEANQLNDMLWSGTRVFVPHGTPNEPHPDKQPILVSHQTENLNKADILLMVGNTDTNKDIFSSFEKCLLVFDGNDPDQTSAVRRSWSTYKNSGFDLTYWQQDTKGKWQQGG
tara:strand:- start:83 stop:535 length:453 start_codon:yes stop_codon:yes gene_type:complete